MTAWTWPDTLQWPAGLPIGDTWEPTAEVAPVRFPYTGETVTMAPVGTADAARRAVAAASTIRRTAGKLSSAVRRAVLQRVWADIDAHRAALVEVLIAETGKPRVDCEVEVTRTALTWSLAAEEVSHLHGETVPIDLLPGSEGVTGYFVRRPAGVVVGITGFNYPLMLASHKIAPAIAAGCPVIVKPAPATPLSTLWLIHRLRLALDAQGAPLSMAQLVTGDESVGAALTTDPAVAVVSFTGSATVGHRIAKAAAPRKVVLELGSNAALVVAADADVNAAVSAVLRGGFYASGQACISVQRVILVAEIADQFTERLLARLPEVVVGDPREAATRVSALIDRGAAERVLSWIDEAVADGALLLAGRRSDGGEQDTTLIPPPTVLADVPSDSVAWQQEIFGPVIALRTVPDFESAVETVNDSRYGLHAAVFTRSLALSQQAIDELEVGGVIINDVPGFRSDAMPYGGVKDSGIGREGPRWAIQEMTVTKMVIIRP